MNKSIAEEFVNIKWQDGVVTENGVNGAQIEDVLALVANRLIKLDPDLSDKNNRETQEHIKKAIDAQYARKADRLKRGVEGKNVK